MSIIKMSCTACGAPISIPEDVLQITCTSCGTSLLVERGEGYVALKIAEKLARAIETSGMETQEVIRENTQVTRTELQRLQLTQELATTEMQLNGIQSEIRMLERESKNPTAVKQLPALHQSEYAAMERLRALKLQLSEPSPDDLNGQIALAEWEIAWTKAEITALKDSAHPQKPGLLANLTERQKKLDAGVIELKARQLKKNYPSFQLEDAPADDAAKLSSLLGILTGDELDLRKLTKTAEGRSVHEEIAQRIKKVQEALHRLDLEKISRKLTSLKDQPDWRDSAALNDHLARVEQDLRSLLDADQTDGVKEITKKILDDRKRTIQQLQALEKGLSLPNTDAAKEPGLKTAHFAGVGQVGLGCLLWVLILIGFFVIGFLIYGLIKPDGTPTNLDMLPVLFFTLVGFALGSQVFLRRTVPTISIQGFAGLPDLVITSKHPESGIRNLRVVKILVGLITCINVILLFLTLVMLTSGNITWLAALLFVIGFVLGPLAAWFIAKRTTISLAA